MGSRQPRQTKAEQQQEALSIIKKVATNQQWEFFHDGESEPWVTFPVNGHRETHKVESRAFWHYIGQCLWLVAQSAPEEVIALYVQRAKQMAFYEGPQLDVHLRVASHDGRVYVDLCDDDWRVVEISADGWTVLADSPLKFRREAGMQALPVPSYGGKLSDLGAFINVRDRDQLLVFAWLTYTLAGRKGPFPPLAFAGNHGTGKSAMTGFFRKLIDPNKALFTGVPRSGRDLAISAHHSFLLAYDNLGALSATMSDELCKAATGSGFRTRQLYTDTREIIINFRAPIIINGITNVVTKPDLLDRTLFLGTQTLKQVDHTLESRFEEARPSLFGAMLTIISAGLRHIDDVVIEGQPPRMVEFARWGSAIEEVLGFEKGTFIKNYRESIADGSAVARENSPLAQLLPMFLKTSGKFHGTALQLRNRLLAFAKSDTNLAPLIKDAAFPRSAAKLSQHLNEIAPLLRKEKIRLDHKREAQTRWIILDPEDARPSVIRHPFDNTGNDAMTADGGPSIH